MPIHPALSIKSISDEEFAAIDREVMGCAYAAQNEFGRLFDEQVYENDVAGRLRDKGFDVQTQVPITVTHGSFEKKYFLDLVVNHMLYELKVVAALSSEHDAQSILYAILQNIRLVKLINFGERKVRGKLLVNALTRADRHSATLRNSGLRILTFQCEQLVNLCRELIHDWGTHLSSQLYNEALVHQFGGEASCLQRVELRSRSILLGTHPVQFYAPGHAFVVTTVTRDQDAYRRHLNTLLSHADLRAMQWINLNHSRVEISTLVRDGWLRTDGKRIGAEEYSCANSGDVPFVPLPRLKTFVHFLPLCAPELYSFAPILLPIPSRNPRPAGFCICEARRIWAQGMNLW